MTTRKLLLEFQKKNLRVSKDAVNPHFKSKYASLDNILDTVSPVLSELWLVIYHYISDGRLVTILSNDWELEDVIRSEFILPEDNNPQKLGSAITYGKRYNISAILNISTDDDDDANAVSTKTVSNAKLNVDAGKQAVKQAVNKVVSDDDKPWFNDPDFDKFKAVIEEGKIVIADYDDAMQWITKKYKVSKKMRDALAEFIESDVLDGKF